MSTVHRDRSLSPAWLLLVLVITVTVLMLFSNMVYSAWSRRAWAEDCRGYYRSQGAGDQDINRKCNFGNNKKV